MITRLGRVPGRDLEFVVLHALHENPHTQIGLGEKDRCAMLSCMNYDKKAKMDHYLTSPPPEDVMRHQTALDEAEDALVHAELVLADAAAEGDEARVARARLAAADAYAALAHAEQPLKYVTNFCYSSNGTVKLSHLIQQWHHCEPTNITYSDDEANMYGECDRGECFAWCREEMPELVPAVRFFYGNNSRAWMGGTTVPILKKPIWVFGDGTRRPRARGEPTPPGGKPSYSSRLVDELTVPEPDEICDVMRSCTGGQMGCGISTLVCVGSHHKMLCEVQRLHPSTNITGQADDTYFNDDERVHSTYQCKRELAWRRNRLTSKLPKVGVYSPIGNRGGNLDGTPPYIPGSPHHPGGILEGGKVSGGYYGNDDWCSAKTAQVLTKKLANLNLIDHITDTGKITNALQLRLDLVRTVASAIPAHWTRLTKPSVIATAAAAVDARVLASFEKLADLDTSPPDRRELAAAVASLRAREGGFDMASFSDTCHANFLAAYTATRPDVARHYPPSASCDAANAFATAAADACTSLTATLADVRDRFTALDMAEFHCVDGVVEHDYHPFIPDAFEMPDADTMRTTPTSKTSRLREKQLNMVVQSDRWVRTLDRVNAFDANNDGATIKRREAKRFVSTSQAGAGAFLRVTGDAAIRGSFVTSPILLSAIQYRAGAYLTAVAPALDERARRGIAVTQSDRLGDTAINSSNATTRHNAVNRCIYNARAAATTACLKLGDKGDGKPRARADAARRTEMYNKGHVPDIIEIDAVDTLYETKCLTPCKEKRARPRLEGQGRRVLGERGLAHRLRRHRRARTLPHARLQAARAGGPGAAQPRQRRRLRGRARRPLCRCALQAPQRRAHARRDHRRRAPRRRRHAQRVAQRDAHRGPRRPHGVRHGARRHQVLLHAPPPPHLARRQRWRRHGRHPLGQGGQEQADARRDARRLHAHRRLDRSVGAGPESGTDGRAT